MVIVADSIAKAPGHLHIMRGEMGMSVAIKMSAQQASDSRDVLHTPEVS